MTIAPSAQAPAPAAPASEPTLDGHSIRMLPASEWYKLASLFEASFPGGQLPPPPPLSHAIVIEQDAPAGGRGEVKFVMFFRQEFHMEPICASRGYGHFFPEMVKLLEGIISEEVVSPGGELYYYCTAENSLGQIAREQGLGRVVLTGHVPVVGKIVRES